MGNTVYANNMAIACKSGAGKVIAAFPDVCMSPPPPPAGPVPIPYPNTSFSKDMKKGSKKVKIGGKPIMLKNKSFYKSSPLGNEAATRSFGAGLVSHQITGKTYFAMWSMDVKVEGENVCRHVDLTTSNHGSYPGNTPPFPNLSGMSAKDISEGQQLAKHRLREGVCPCCGKEDCPGGVKDAQGNNVKVDNPNTDDRVMGWSDFYLGARTGDERAKRTKKLEKLLKERAGDCTCDKSKNTPFPKPPCDVFIAKEHSSRTKTIALRWDTKRPDYKKKYNLQNPKNGIPSYSQALAKATKESQKSNINFNVKERVGKLQHVMHLTPKSAGGCPDCPSNLQPYAALCKVCQGIDDACTNLLG